MTPPLREALREAPMRLLRAPNAKGNAPKRPFGGAFVSDENASVLAVEIDREETLAALVARLPHASTLPVANGGAWIVVLGGATRGALGLFGKRDAAPRSLRASALLACGYREIEAITDDVTSDDLIVARA